VAETAFTIESLNELAQTETITVFRNVEQNEKLWSHFKLYRNLETKKFIKVNDRSQVSYGKPRFEPGNEWILVHCNKVYARPKSLSRSWGAYIIPQGVKAGDRVYLPDLIEDVYAHRFWSAIFPANDGVGIWNGSDLVLDVEVYKEAYGSIIG